MPIYEYKCVNGHINTEQRYIQDRKTAGKCEVCEELTWLCISAVRGTVTGSETPCSGKVRSK